MNARKQLSTRNPRRSESKLDTPQQLDAPVIRQAVLKRRIKAFLVSSFAAFMMLCLIWSFTTSKYIAQNKIGLGLINNPEIDAQQSHEILTQLVQDAWDASTSEKSIREHLLRLKGVASKGAIEAADFDVAQIQNAIGYKLENLNGRFQIGLVLEGRGTRDEKRLIDRIAVKLASDLALVPIRQLAELQNKPGLSKELAQRLSQPINAIRQAQQLAGDVEANLEEMKSLQAMDAASSNHSETYSRALHERKAELLGELKQLQFEEQRLAGLALSEPSVARVERQLFDVKDELGQIESRLLEVASAAAQNGNSPFRTASFSNSAKHSDIKLPLSEAADLNQYLKSVNRELVKLQQQINDNPSSGLTLPPVPVFVQSFQKASIKPQNGINVLGPLISLSLLALALGSVVAWRLKPLAEDVGFKNQRNITELLRLPVVAQLSRQTGDEIEKEDELPLANLTVKASELIVLTALAMIACMLLFSPSIRAAFLENPLHGISEILWKIQGK